MSRIRDFINMIRELPWSVAVLAGLLMAAAVASSKLEGFDDFELESQLDGTRESLKVCTADLNRASLNLAETTMWMRESRAKFLEVGLKAMSLEGQIKELQDKHRERMQALATAAPVTKAIKVAPAPKKAVQRKRWVRKPRPILDRDKNFWDHLAEAMS